MYDPRAIRESPLPVVGNLLPRLRREQAPALPVVGKLLPRLRWEQAPALPVVGNLLPRLRWKQAPPPYGVESLPRCFVLERV